MCFQENVDKAFQAVHRDHQECLEQFKFVAKERASFLRGIKL